MTRIDLAAHAAAAGLVASLLASCAGARGAEPIAPGPSAVASSPREVSSASSPMASYARCELETALPKTPCDREEEASTGPRVGQGCNSPRRLYAQSAMRLGECFAAEVAAGRSTGGAQRLDLRIDEHGEVVSAEAPGRVFGAGSDCMTQVMRGRVVRPEPETFALMQKVEGTSLHELTLRLRCSAGEPSNP